MSRAIRRARVRALAKINLDLRVLHRRLDGYHELRTVFQTISLSDTIDIEFRADSRSQVRIESNIPIENNLIAQAAEACLDRTGKKGQVAFTLSKVIPMGSGLGGGSSDAAAVLLALPVLMGVRLPLEKLIPMARGLGSDVPFFLLGGAAVALGRGDELYPLPDLPARHVVIAAPGVAVSTAEAYRGLGRGLTFDSLENTIDSFQSRVWGLARGLPARLKSEPANDFEQVVFRRFPEFEAVKRRLGKLGAEQTQMTGSGSALFGLFRSQGDADRALVSLRKGNVFAASLVSRARYRALWSRWLRAHVDNGQKVWPLESRKTG